jgi:3-oxoacyl-[acyl-carrier protein] reductase
MLDGYSILITGASEGLGRGIALAAGSAGAAVTVTALDASQAEAVAEEIRGRGGKAIGVRCNVTSQADMEAAAQAAVAAFGKLDCFIHNANDSGAGARAVEDVRDEHWQPSVTVGLRPIFYVAKSVLPELVRAQGSLIVLTSPAGIDGTATLPVYSTVKGAQRGLVRALAREWGPLGVRVNALSPSAVTPALIAYLEREPHMRPHMVKRAALRRMGDPELDIGRALNFLIGPASRFVTGQTLIVSGGAMML